MPCIFVHVTSRFYTCFMQFFLSHSTLVIICATLGMCAWNNHYCWPGNCGSDGLTQDCVCDAGFRRVLIDGAAIYSGNTTCQPTQTPTILTCDTVAVGPNGEKKRAMSSATPFTCANLQDMYGNFQPYMMQFNMTSNSTTYVASTSKPAFIIASNFGISDSTIYIKHRRVNGKNVKYISIYTYRKLN